LATEQSSDTANLKEMIDQRLDYLHNNPVESGAVDYPPNYLYSSAKDYYTDEKGLLPVILLS
jgi:hypothetical protein